MKEIFKDYDYTEADVYQDFALKTAIYPNQGTNPYYPALGLGGEVGELCNKIKKMMRDGITKEELKETIKGEIGDVMWYVATLAKEFDLKLSDILSFNLNKLYDRMDRGVLKGSGDNR